MHRTEAARSNVTRQRSILTFPATTTLLAFVIHHPSSTSSFPSYPSLPLLHDTVS
jgi:hypothetical protein